jgi:hypothetical protein
LSENAPVTQTPAAGWFPDPEDATQLRYWDGAAWTEHRSPRPAVSSDPLAQAGADLVDGVSRAFAAAGGWLSKNVGSSGTAAAPTFASIAAACTDLPPGDLTRSVEVVMDPADRPGLVPLFAASSSALGPLGDTLVVPCRVVPNPWNPADPNGVAVFVGATLIGRLPAAAAAEYSPVVTPLASAGRLVTGSVAITAAGEVGQVSTASAVVRLPEPGAVGG